MYKFLDSGPIQQTYKILTVGAIASRYLGTSTANKAVTKIAVALATTQQKDSYNSQPHYYGGRNATPRGFAGEREGDQKLSGLPAGI